MRIRIRKTAGHLKEPLMNCSSEVLETEDGILFVFSARKAVQLFIFRNDAVQESVLTINFFSAGSAVADEFFHNTPPFWIRVTQLRLPLPSFR